MGALVTLRFAPPNVTHSGAPKPFHDQKRGEATHLQKKQPRRALWRQIDLSQENSGKRPATCCYDPAYRRRYKPR
jgi:hypothetical protein